ncbi:MAG: hypothetical protein GOVbin2277_55 [Prokaryotic dsDNA virus sp.]|jgi:hypothetical protein|nr:MAG: hypothetical protein GOVbin2277_55 [Prokaryotic dsDNA virus sp.]|tara:strand:+ start:296 stop:688 length:393 start_codon:yes stop_codon:yes gene_type:complete
MLNMEPVTLTVIAVVASLGVGFGAGWGLKPDAGVKALEAQTEAIEALNDGNQALVDKVQEVAVEEAKRETVIANKLTDLPPPCIKEVGGDPMSLQCMWALCIRTGETDKQRCEPSKLTDKLLGSYSCSEQ